MSNTLPCPKCGSMKSSVKDSRSYSGGVKRRRVCRECDLSFNTMEAHESKSSCWAIGDLVQTKDKGLMWKGVVIGSFVSRSGSSGAIVENRDGAVFPFKDNSLKPWQGFMGRKTEWTPEMLRILREMRANGESYLECAYVIGVTDDAVSRKCRELGLHGKMNHGRRSARDVVKEAISQLDG